MEDCIAPLRQERLLELRLPAVAQLPTEGTGVPLPGALAQLAVQSVALAPVAVGAGGSGAASPGCVPFA